MRVVSPEDLSPGMSVAVLANRVLVPPGDAMDADERVEYALRMQQESNAPPTGILLRVLAVDVPLAVCSVIRRKGRLRGPVVIDVRQTVLGELSTEFLAAFESFRKTRRGA